MTISSLEVHLTSVKNISCKPNFTLTLKQVYSHMAIIQSVTKLNRLLVNIVILMLVKEMNTNIVVLLISLQFPTSGMGCCSGQHRSPRLFRRLLSRRDDTSGRGNYGQQCHSHCNPRSSKDMAQLQVAMCYFSRAWPDPHKSADVSTTEDFK